jgi:hypothetical protein
MTRPAKSAGTNIATAPPGEFKTTVRFIALERLFIKGKRYEIQKTAKGAASF